MYTLKDGVLTIDDGVTEIPNLFLFGRKEIKSVIIPEGVKKIGAEAFAACKNLTTVIIPESVEEIGKDAFANCAIDYLESKALKIKNGCALSDNGLKVLYGTNAHLTEITIPEGVERIGYAAFYGYKNITTITIPESIRKIGRVPLSFRNCQNIKKIIYRGTKEKWKTLGVDFTKRRRCTLLDYVEDNSLKEDSINAEIIFEK